MAIAKRPYPKSRSLYTSEVLWKAEKLGIQSETLHLASRYERAYLSTRTI